MSTARHVAGRICCVGDCNQGRTCHLRRRVDIPINETTETFARKSRNPTAPFDEPPTDSTSDMLAEVALYVITICLTIACLFGAL